MSVHYCSLIDKCFTLKSKWEGLAKTLRIKSYQPEKEAVLMTMLYNVIFSESNSSLAFKEKVLIFY